LHHLRRTGQLENLRRSAAILGRLSPAVVVWACTSGSFVDGLDHAKAQAGAASEAAGCPRSSTSLAFAAACSHPGISTVSVLASYPDATSEAFRRFLEKCALEVTAMRWLSIPSGPRAAEIGTDAILALASTMSLRGAEALLIPDTAIPAWPAIAPLEAQLAIPILTANQVTLWEALRLADVLQPHRDWGLLFH